MNVLSLFSGIGAYEKALTNLDIPYTLKNFCEINPNAVKSYCAIHNVDATLNLGDITKVKLEQLPKAQLVVHGSPCQDYSVAGTNNGGDAGTNTRSSLMWHSVEIIRHVKPDYIVWENVKGILQDKHKHNFERYLKDLDDMGYVSYYSLLNAQDFGVPQRRIRIFVVSIRKDKNQTFNFPKPTCKVPLKLKDILESEVVENYKTINPKLTHLIMRMEEQANVVDWTQPISWKEQLSNLTNTIDYKFTTHYLQYDLSGKGYGSQDQRAYYDTDSVGTLLSSLMSCKVLVGCDTLKQGEIPHLCIHKLTAKEAFRLMGFNDMDYAAAYKENKSQRILYQQAGNSIVVPILEEIFKELLITNKKG